MKKAGQYLFVLIIIASTAFIVYKNPDNFIPAYENLLIYSKIRKPCNLPIYYYIDNFDNRFNINKDEFIKLLEKSADIWNQTQKDKLLIYDEKTAKSISNYSRYKLPINLIYDKRQETTNSLKVIDTDIESNKEDYNSNKSDYEQIKIEYDNKKIFLQNLITQYETSKIAYEQEIINLNKNYKNISQAKYNEIEQKRLSLNKQVTEINKLNNELNLIVSKLNTKATELNSLNKDINSQINKYNKLSQTNGPEFQEGEYIIDKEGQRINVYEFKDLTTLQRVLSHEFGHALGIDHVEGQDSIMNAYNNSRVTSLSIQDLSALKAICK